MSGVEHGLYTQLNLHVYWDILKLTRHLTSLFRTQTHHLHGRTSVPFPSTSNLLQISYAENCLMISEIIAFANLRCILTWISDHPELHFVLVPPEVGPQRRGLRRHGLQPGPVETERLAAPVHRHSLWSAATQTGSDLAGSFYGPGSNPKNFFQENLPN